MRNRSFRRERLKNETPLLVSGGKRSGSVTGTESVKSGSWNPSRPVLCGVDQVIGPIMHKTDWDRVLPQKTGIP
jgi:hypothetical protein